MCSRPPSGTLNWISGRKWMGMSVLINTHLLFSLSLVLSCCPLLLRGFSVSVGSWSSLALLPLFILSHRLLNSTNNVTLLWWQINIRGTFNCPLNARGVVTADGSACLICHGFYADTTPPFIWVCDPTEVEFVSPPEIEPGLTTEAPIKSIIIYIYNIIKL